MPIIRLYHVVRSYNSSHVRETIVGVEGADSETLQLLVEGVHLLIRVI